MALQGPIPVQFAQMFPHGAYAAGVIEPVRDFDASKDGRFVQAKDRESGLPLWAVDVIDADPAARVKTARVKIAASDQPVLPPAAPGMPFSPVELTGLAVIPYVNPAGRLAYSLKAAGITAARGSRGAHEGGGPGRAERGLIKRDGRELAPSGRPRSLPPLGMSNRKR